jgi:hypothetical protein
VDSRQTSKVLLRQPLRSPRATYGVPEAADHVRIAAAPIADHRPTVANRSLLVDSLLVAFSAVAIGTSPVEDQLETEGEHGR